MTSPPSPLRVAPSVGADPSAVTAREIDGLPERLASVSDDVAQRALGELTRRADLRGTEGAGLAADVATRLSTDALLPERAQDERLRALLARLALDATGLRVLADRARTFPRHLRNTAAGVLPPELRRAIYAAPSGPRPLSEELSVSLRPSERVPAQNDLIPSAPSAEPPKAAIGITAVAEGRSYSTVLLLSQPARQEGNRALLREREFGPLVMESLAQLRQDLAGNDDVCAYVVDRSFLETLDAAGQRAVFEALAAYSTFILIRVDDHGLRLSHDEIRDIIKRERCLGNPVAQTALSFQADSSLRAAEMADFEHARAALRSYERAEFVPGELSPSEGRLLVAAARTHLQAGRLDGPLIVNSLTTRFLRGGLSGARLATVRVNDGTQVLVAKITTKRGALDEIRRFRVFVQEWDNQLQPELYFHGDAALILFGLVPSEQDCAEPAAMLEERIGDLWSDQYFGSVGTEELAHRAYALGRGLERLARRLIDLNVRRPGSSGFRSCGNPTTHYAESLEALGFDWGLAPIVVTARTKAAARFRRLEHAGVVHGDLHLRNILLRGEAEAHLIDYAGSGPGHPAVDLVRLELALYLIPMRQLDGEEQCADFQRRLSIDRATFELLIEQFPALTKCHVNNACARAMVAARDAAVDVLQHHGGNPDDYLAAKYLLAWESLGVIGRHTGLARIVITTLTAVIAAWE